MSINIGGPSNFNVTQWNGTAVTTPDTAGSPKVTLTAGSGTGQILLTAGAVTVGTNNDKTAYSLTAGSYSVRASSSQRATAAFASGGLTVTITISSVTTTRASCAGGGTGSTTTVGPAHGTDVYIQLATATTITGTRGGGTDSAAGNQIGTAAAEVWELF